MHWSCEWMAWCDQSINQSHGSSVWFMERVKLIFSCSYWIVASIVDKSKGKWAHRPRYFHSGLPTLPHVACVMCPIGTSWWWWWMLFISKPLTNGTLPLLWAFPTPQTNVGRLVKSIINYCKPRTLLFQQVSGLELRCKNYGMRKWRFSLFLNTHIDPPYYIKYDIECDLLFGVTCSYIVLLLMYFLYQVHVLTFYGVQRTNLTMVA